MVDLPTPKRAVIYRDPVLVWITTDLEVVEFVNTLACVTGVSPHLYKNTWFVDLDERYAYDDTTRQQCIDWIEEQIQDEFKATLPPMKENGDH